MTPSWLDIMSKSSRGTVDFFNLSIIVDVLIPCRTHYCKKRKMSVSTFLMNKADK